MTNTNKKYYTVQMFTKETFKDHHTAVYTIIKAEDKEQANQIAINKYESKGYTVNADWTKQKFNNKTEVQSDIKEDIEFFDWEYRRAKAAMKHFEKIKKFYEQQYENNK